MIKKSDHFIWEKIKVNEFNFLVYKFYNEDKSECYYVYTLSQMLDCLEKSTKEEREKYYLNLYIWRVLSERIKKN